LKLTATMKGLERAAVAVVFALALALPLSASAATTIGAYSPSTTIGGCSACAVVQSQDSGPDAYTAPADGVITRYTTRSGTVLTAADRFRLLVLTPGPALEWKLVAAGEQQGWPGTAPAFQNYPLDFGARVPIKAGQHLGIESHMAGGNWFYSYTTGNALDAEYTLPGVTNVGETSFGASGFSANRINLQATVEADSDNDGFGDESQDLCVGTVGSAAGCPGTVLGSPLTNALNAGWNADTTVMQKTLPGATLAAPADGVILHWGAKGSASSTTDRLQILRQNGAGYDVVARSAAVSQMFSTNSIIGGATRIPVRAGDRIGMGSTGSVPTWSDTSTANELTSWVPQVAAVGGHVEVPTSSNNSELLFGAVFEPDADHDNYGDISEDACPSDPTTQGACVIPVISGLKLTPNNFRVNSKGAVLSAASVKKGSKISLVLTRASKVSLMVSLKFAGRNVGGNCVKQNSTNKSKHKCPYYRMVHTFSRDLPLGASKFAYSGRYKKGSKKKSLKPGIYRLRAEPKSASSGALGQAVATYFTVAAAQKK
jgi:hypothetical protein